MTDANFDYLDRRLTGSKAIVLDVETTGLSWQRDYPVGYVLTFSSDPADSHYLPVRHEAGGNLDVGKVLSLLRPQLARQDLKVVGHNLKFDLHFCANDDLVVNGPLEDTMVDAFLVNENARSFALDACCREYRVVEKKGEVLYQHLAAKFGGEPNRNQMGSYWKLAGDDPIGLDYAIGDGTSTYQLWETLQSDLDAQDLRRVWDVECRCIRALFRMERRGIRIDEERLEQVADIVDQQLKTALIRLPPDFNQRAPTHMKKLFTDAGITNWPTTPPSKNFPNGQPSFSEAWLIQSPLGRDVVAARKFAHMRDAFITPLRERHLWKGRVHTTFNQTRGEAFGTVTGRLSSSNPNMQQIPVRDEVLGPLFRSVFVPDPGMIWGSQDISQCEPRLLAHYAKVKVLLEGYLSTPAVDAHSAVATAAGIDRQSAKRANQALLTGAGKAKAALTLGLPLDEATRVIDAYFARMPEIPKFQKYAASVFRARGYIRSWLGRRSRLEDPRFDYRALNRILQLGNADLLKSALVNVDEYYASENDVVCLLNNVHDSFDDEFFPEHRKIHEEAVRLMEDYGPGKTVEFAVPILMETKEGSDWSIATFGVDTVRKSFQSVGSYYDDPSRAAA